HLEPAPGRELGIESMDLDTISGVTGVTVATAEGVREIAGTPSVTDTAAALFSTDPPIDPGVTWRRQAAAFFQANRFLVGALVRRVLDFVEGDRVADLYAGVGLFSVALAASGRQVVAVEGDPYAGADLASNAKPWPDRLLITNASVERAVAQPP